MKKVFWVIGIIIVIVILIFVLSKKGKKIAETESLRGQKQRSAVVQKKDIAIVLDEIGVLEPLKEVNLKSKISGKILKLFVEEGDLVAIGDTIAIIEPDMQQARTLSQIKSNLKTAQINLETAEKDYKSDKNLYEQDLISYDNFLSSKNNLKIAQINYESALEQYNLVKEEGITETNLKITSPANGTIIIKNVEEGEMVVSSESYSGGTVLLTIANLAKMIILSEINEVDIGKIDLGQSVEINIDAFPENDYSGKITHIAPMATIGNNNIRVFQVKISVNNLSPELKPGMSANITIIGKKHEDVLTIPIQAIFQDENENNIVYKIESDTIITKKIIKTGINDLEKVEIIEGLVEGDTVSLVEKSVKEEDKNKKIRFRTRIK